MSDREQVDFSKYGTKFQEGFAALVYHDRAFSDQIREVFDLEFLELKYLQTFVGKVFDYRDKYESHPAQDTMITILRTELEDCNELVVQQIKQFFARVIAESKVEGGQYIKDVSLNFCRKQKLKGALIESADLILRDDNSSYDEIRKMIDNALKLGCDNDCGYDYIADFEKRFELKARSPITTGWKLMDSLMHGGLGSGELGVVIAPTGVGKSMALVHLGAQGIKEGKTVIHYTLELADTVVASRYDSTITGISLNDLWANKEDVYDLVKDLDGRLIVKEYPTKTATTATIHNHLEKLIRLGINPDMIIVDYGDLLRPIDKRKEKRNELESIYEELRSLAQQYNCPVWTASQTNRSGLNAEVITMESISEAFNKCFVADFIFTISRTIEDKSSNEGRIFIAKNRNGPDGIVFPIFMDTSTVTFKILQNTGETIADIAKNTAKKQEALLREKYKDFKNSRKKKGEDNGN